MVQKIIKVGNSNAVTLNKKYLELMGLSSGDQVQSEYIPETKKIIFSLPEEQPESITDVQVLKNLKSLKKRYGKLYQKLAQQSEKTLS